MRNSLPALAIGAFAWSAGAFGGINTFTQTGPYGGPVQAVAFHPTRPSTVFVSTEAELYRSMDVGTSWQPVITRSVTPITAIKFDPTNPDRIIALNQLLARSDDGGATFGNFLSPDNETLTSIDFSPNGHLFAMTLSGRLLKSTDAGTTWAQLPVPWPTTENSSRRVFADPANPNILFVMVPSVGTYRTTNAASSWTLLPGSPGSRKAGDTGWVWSFKPGDSKFILVVAIEGLMRSADGGDTWTETRSGFYHAWVGFDPLQPDHALAVTLGGQVVRSTDSGLTWPAALNGAIVRAGYTYDAAMHPGIAGRVFLATTEGPMYSVNGGDTFVPLTSGIRSGSVQSFAPAADGTVYAGFMSPASVYRRGADWQPVNSEPLFVNSTKPLSVTGTATSWGNSSVLYVSDYEGRVLRSGDSGSTWGAPSASLVNSLIYDVAADPADANIAHAAAYDGMWRTGDGGLSWQQAPTVLNTFMMRVVTTPADPQRVYAGATTPARVFVSSDRGVTWTPTAALPASPQLYSLDVDPLDPNIVYAFLGTQQVMKSVNGGAEWKDFSVVVNGSSMITGGYVLADLQARNTLIIPTNTTYRGFVRTVDGGATWDRTSLDLGGDTYVIAATLLPTKPTTMILNYSGLGIVEYTVATDLSLQYTGPADLALSSSSTTQFKVTNLGPHAASPSQLRVKVPGWLTPASAPGCTFTAPNLTCAVPALHLNESRTVDVPMSATATPSDGQLDATLLTHEDDVAPANNAVLAGVHSKAIADMAITGSADGNVVSGTAFTRTLTVTNNGPNDSPGNVVTLVIPAIFNVTAATTRGTCTIAATGSSCNLGAMPAAATATITLTITPTSSGNADMSATVAGTAADKNAANDTMSYSTPVAAPPPPAPAPAPKGGGGGGRFDWAALGLLGLLAARSRRASLPRSSQR